MAWLPGWTMRPLEEFRALVAKRDGVLLARFDPPVGVPHARRRREYPEPFPRPEHAHLTVVRLRSPREARRWLAGVPRSALRSESS